MEVTIIGKPNPQAFARLLHLVEEFVISQAAKEAAGEAREVVIEASLAIEFSDNVNGLQNG